MWCISQYVDFCYYNTHFLKYHNEKIHYQQIRYYCLFSDITVAM